MSEKSVSVSLSQREDYRFDIDFGGEVPVLTTDESVPLGTGLGPTPVQLLCAAAANCLCDSLLFALRKFKQAPEPIRCRMQADIGRNDQGRLRVQAMRAEITLGVPAAGLQHLDRVLAQFEAFCTVAQTIGQAVPIEVAVFDSEGARLK